MKQFAAGAAAKGVSAEHFLFGEYRLLVSRIINIITLYSGPR